MALTQGEWDNAVYRFVADGVTSDPSVAVEAVRQLHGERPKPEQYIMDPLVKAVEDAVQAAAVAVVMGADPDALYDRLNDALGYGDSLYRETVED